MKKHFKLIALVYLTAVMVLLGLEFSQFRKVDRLRDQITQSYHLISGRDEGLRLELEFRRFQNTLAAYALGHDVKTGRSQLDAVTHDDVTLWFDIFWSRIFSIDRYDLELHGETSAETQALLEDLRSTLKRLDPKVRALQPGDIASFKVIRDEMDKYDDEISDVATTIAQRRHERATALQEKLNGALESVDTLLLTSAAGGVLILSLFGGEAYRARREERKTRSREARVRFLAEHDTLTGLGNRSYLNEKMAQFVHEAERTGEGFYFLLLDLDKFKDVNDTFGHPMGDRLLKKAASRLMAIFESSNNVVVRLGGDEFAILMYGDHDEVESTAQAIILSLSSIFNISGQEIRISTSIGISRYPDLSSSMENLLRDADLALYEAKNRGRHTYTIYEPSMSVAVSHRMRLEADLRRAMKKDNGGLEVYYQPQVSLGSGPMDGEIIGVEALVRWFHPDLGQIPTMDFIDIAEGAGLIDELSNWILRQACSDVVAWHQVGFMLHLSVNLSPLQLNNPTLPQELLAHLDNYGFDPNYLTLEITESSDVTDTKAAAKMLNMLAEKGISLAMDDFGTGYSNLGYLNSLPLNTLKIDRSFVMQIGELQTERKLVRGIINLARGMGLKIVAEGVETEDQVAFLREENCDAGQGYLFGRPIHKLGMLALLNEQYARREGTERQMAIEA